MTDIKFALEQELSSLSFEVTAEDIKNIYLKRKRRSYTIYTTCAVSIAAAFVILLSVNAPAVEEFMNSFKSNFGSPYSSSEQTGSMVYESSTAADTTDSQSLQNTTATEKSRNNETVQQSAPEVKVAGADEKTVILSEKTTSPAETESKEKTDFNEKVKSLDFSYSVLSDKTLKITGIKNLAKAVTIPEKIDGKTVTVIGSKAFENSSIKKVVLPDTITAIESYAFCEANSLEEITLSKKLKTIGNYAFEKCGSLKEINLTNVEHIGTMAFYKCNSLSALTVPSSVKEIGTRAFSTCKSIKTIELNCDYKADVPSDEYARTFENCTSLQTLKIGGTVANIREKAFSGCGALSQISFPESLKNIWDRAFENCIGLKEITVPKGTEEIGSMAFIGCTNLTKAEILGDNTSLNWCSLGYYEDKYKNPKKTDGLTIYCNKGSKAESYAKANKIQTVTGG